MIAVQLSNHEKRSKASMVEKINNYTSISIGLLALTPSKKITTGIDLNSWFVGYPRAAVTSWLGV